MNRQGAVWAQSNIDDGWPYPDDNSDMRDEPEEDDHEESLDTYEPYEPNPYDGTYSEE